MVVTCLSAGHNPLLHNGKCRHPAALLPGPIHRCSASQGQPLQPAARPVHGTQTSSQRLYACDHTVHTHLNEDDVHVTNCSSDLSLSVVCLFALCVLGRWGMGGGGEFLATKIGFAVFVMEWLQFQLPDLHPVCTHLYSVFSFFKVHY